MATDAQGRLLSDDGIYYWDGTDWQLVDQAAGADSSAQSQDAQGRVLSDDGNYFWDGTDWRLVDKSGTGASTGAHAGAGSSDWKQQFVQAMARAGYQIDVSAVPELNDLQSGLAAALQFYGSLDHTTRSVIEHVTSDPGEQASIGLAETWIVTGIDSLLHAFDHVEGSLGDLLDAAQQALETVQQQTVNQ